MINFNYPQSSEMGSLRDLIDQTLEVLPRYETDTEAAWPVKLLSSRGGAKDYGWLVYEIEGETSKWSFCNHVSSRGCWVRSSSRDLLGSTAKKDQYLSEEVIVTTAPELAK